MKRIVCFLLVLCSFSVCFAACTSGNDNEWEVKARKDMVRGEVNVMSFNMLSETWNNAPSAKSRVKGNLAQIEAYLPDVVGLQEMDAASDEVWEESLRAKNSPYVFADNTLQNGEHNSYTQILYNANEVKLLESGLKEYDYSGSANCRVMSWAHFEEISSGKKFIFVTTHWDFWDGTIPSGYLMEKQAVELASYTKGLMEKYGTTNLFVTGDFNCIKTSKYFSSYLTKSGYIDASEQAEVKGLLCGTYSKWTGLAPESKPSVEYVNKETDVAEFAEQAIDFITYNPNGVKVNYFTVICNKTSWHSSDHCPLFASFDLP